MRYSMLLAVLAVACVASWSADLGALRWSDAALRLGVVALTADGGTIAVAESFGIGVYRASDGVRTALLRGHTATVTGLAFVPNETILASGSIDGTVRTWNYSGIGGQRACLTVGSPVTCVAVTFAGTVAAGAEDGGVRLFSASAGTSLGVLSGHTGPVAAVMATAGGNIASAGVTDGKLIDWNLATLTSAHAVTPAPGLGIRLAAANGPGTAVAAIDDAGDVWTWDPVANTLDHDSFTMEYPVALVGFGATQFYIGSEQGPVALCTPAANTLASTHIDHTVGPVALAISADGLTLVTAADDGAVRVWSTTIPGGPMPVITRADREVGALACSSLGVVAVAEADTVDRTVRLFASADGSAIATLTSNVPVDSLAFSPDGATLAVGSLHKAIEIWRMNDRTRLRTISNPAGVTADIIDCIAWSPDGTQIAAGAWNMFEMYAHINIYTVSDGALVRQIFPAADETMGTIDAIAWSPAGDTVATVGYDQAVRIWDVGTGAETVLTGHDGYPQALAYTPDGSLLVSGDLDGQVRLWDTADHTCIGVLDTGLDGVMVVAITPEGTAMAAAGFDGAIALYRLADGALMRTQTGHTGVIHGLAFASGGALLAGGVDGLACWQALLAQPDVRIRAATDAPTAWVGDNVYVSNTGPQVRNVKTTSDAPTPYIVRLENDGLVADTFTVTGTASNGGMTVAYAWADTPGDITTAITGGLVRLPLQPGASRDLLVTVVLSAAAVGTTYEVHVGMQSSQTAATDDQVTAMTTRITRLPTVGVTAQPGLVGIVGDMVRLTAVPDPAFAQEYLFRVGLRTGAVTIWTTVRGFRADPVVLWTPAVAGSYYLEVIARNAGTKVTSAVARISYTVAPKPANPITGVTLEALPSGVSVGGTATLRAHAVGGGTVEYLFRVGRINGAAITWSTLRGFRTDVTCPWIPSQGGQYVLEVQARELGTRTVVAVKRISYGVGP